MTDTADPSPVLAATLQLAVPLHITELQHLNQDQLHHIAVTSADAIAAHGDDLQYGGKHCAEAFNALARGFAVAALTAWGGITWRGMHWCQNPACTNPDAPHDLPDGTPRIPAPRPRPVETVPTTGGIL